MNKQTTSVNQIPPMRYLREYARSLKTEGYSDAEIFGKLLREFTGTPYVWGGATTEASDCSGTVCAALNALYERERRVTADDLYRRFFTRPFLELPRGMQQCYEQRIHALCTGRKAPATGAGYAARSAAEHGKQKLASLAAGDGSVQGD